MRLTLEDMTKAELIEVAKLCAPYGPRDLLRIRWDTLCAKELRMMEESRDALAVGDYRKHELLERKLKQLRRQNDAVYAALTGK